jgi:hypothetical protein
MTCPTMYAMTGSLLMENMDHDRIADGTGTAILYDAERHLALKVHDYHGHLLD